MSALTKALRITALLKMVKLGHQPTPWSFIAQAEAKGSYCSACWAMVWVLADPPKVGGQAITVACLAKP
jgi:hypothetical protein